MKKKLWRIWTCWNEQELINALNNIENMQGIVFQIILVGNPEFVNGKIIGEKYRVIYYTIGE